MGYPKSARAGIGGRGEEDSRTSWFHTYVQDDWRLRSNLTVNYGLRYEINQHLREVDNRLSSIDFSVPGGRYVIASDDQGNISPAAEALLPLIPIPWVTSADIGWDRSLLRPSYRRFAPRLGLALTLGERARTVIRGGYGIFLNQWAYSVQTAFTRNLPFFLLKQVEAAADDPLPTLTTRGILTSDPTGSVGGAIMDHDFRTEYTQTWSAGIQHEVRPRLVVEGFYMGSSTIGADNSTLRNVPVPGPGPIDPRRSVPELAGIPTIRFDGSSIYHALTLKAEKRLADGHAFSANYTLSTSRDDASSPGPTEAEANMPQDVRDLDAENGRSSFDHRHVLVASGTYEVPFLRNATGWRQAVGGNWRVNAIVTLQSGGALHRQSRDRQCQYWGRSGPAPQRVWRSESEQRPDTRAVVRHGRVFPARAVYLRERPPEQGSGARVCKRGCLSPERLGSCERHSAGVSLGSVQSPQPCQL